MRTIARYRLREIRLDIIPHRAAMTSSHIFHTLAVTILSSHPSYHRHSLTAIKKITLLRLCGRVNEKERNQKFLRRSAYENGERHPTHSLPWLEHD
jgi:hypothetical protein